MLQRIRELITNLAKMFPQLGKFIARIGPLIAGITKLARLGTPLGLLISALGALKTLFTDLSAEIEKGIKPTTDAIKAFHQSFLNSFASEKDLKAMLAEVESDIAANNERRKESLFRKGSTEDPKLSAEERDQVLRQLLEEKNQLLDTRNELNSQLETLRAGREEILATTGTFTGSLTQLEAAIGEEGLLAAFLELDAALQSADLPAGLEALAGAVEVAAARIANAAGGTQTNGKASGGTVAPGQPVLVGERGPEIFVPSSAGSIVNAFDASADPSAIGAAGSSGQIVQALESLEDTIGELDETIQEAENAGLNGVGGAGRPSSSRRRFGSRGGGTSALDEVENFLATVESTSEAFENIERTMSDFRNQAENDFEGISEAGQQAFQSILGSIQSLVSNFIGGKAGRVVGTIAGFARIFRFGLAGGGDLQPGLPVLVGERGPEVIVPRVPLSVKNNADTRRLLGGGSPIVVNQTVNMSTDVKNTIRAEVLNAMPIAAQLAARAVAASLQGRRF